MPCVRDVHPLVGPEGDGDLGPGVIAVVGDGIFRVDGEHPMGGDLLISFALGDGEAPKDGGDHFVMVLEGVVVAPRWSAASGSVVGVVFQLFVLKLLSQAEIVLHLVFGVLVKRAWAIKDLLVLLVVVALGARLTDGGDFGQTWVLQVGHGRCHDGNCGRRSGGHCGIGHRGDRHSSEEGDECPHPR